MSKTKPEWGKSPLQAALKWLIYKRLMEKAMEDSFSRYRDEPKVKK